MYVITYEICYNFRTKGYVSLKHTEIKAFIVLYKLARFENFWILTSNDPKYPSNWGRVSLLSTVWLSRDRDLPFIYYLATFESNRILVPNDPDLGRLTSNALENDFFVTSRLARGIFQFQNAKKN